MEEKDEWEAGEKNEEGKIDTRGRMTLNQDEWRKVVWVVGLELGVAG